MEPLDWLPYEKRYYYPGMARLDTAIWERFIAAHHDAYDAVCYNVAIGDGAAFDTVVSPETGGDVNRLYQRKIDVIGRKGQTFTVLEIGPRASTAKLGQVRGYARLLKDELPADAVLNTMVVTDTELPHMSMLAADDGVGFEVV